MQFKLDENIPTSLKSVIQGVGHQASTVYEQGLSGASDQALADACKGDAMILITLDVDFANIVGYPPRRIQALWS